MVLMLGTPDDDRCDVPILHPEAVREAKRGRLTIPEAQELATIFSLFADPTRVRIVAALAARELCVCDLANVLNLRQSTVSHQLRLLRAVRIVRFRKEGRMAFYTLADAHVAALLCIGVAHTREGIASRPATGTGVGT